MKGECFADLSPREQSGGGAASAAGGPAEKHHRPFTQSRPCDLTRSQLSASEQVLESLHLVRDHLMAHHTGGIVRNTVGPALRSWLHPGAILD